jgi:hypothetical protein
MRKQTEDYLQNQCWIWFTNNHRDKGIFVSIPNDESNVVQSKRKTLTGRRKGAADVVLILNRGRVIWVEFKTLTGRQSEFQKQFETRVTSLGHKYIIIRSLKEFQEFCKINLENI